MARMDSAPQTAFAARVEVELRRRREQTLDRCATCGSTIERDADYAHVRGRVVHADCAVPSLFRAA